MPDAAVCRHIGLPEERGCGRIQTKTMEWPTESWVGPSWEHNALEKVPGTATEMILIEGLVYSRHHFLT